MAEADLFSVVYSCGRVQRFLDTPIGQDILAEVLFAGSRAQTTGDQQLLKFITFNEASKVKALYDACYEEDAVMSAQAAIVITAEHDLAEKHFGLRGKRLYVVQDCAAAAQNILLAAHALGLGGMWIHAFDEAQVANLCGIPDEARPQAVLLLGYPADEIERPPLKDFRYLVNWEAYGGKHKDPHILTNDFAVQWERLGTQFKQLVERQTRPIAKKARIGSTEEFKERGAETVRVMGKRFKKGFKRAVRSLKK